MSPLVSVIIPTYNRRPLLARALDSVFSQSFRDYEVIVVDDGSEDGTQEDPCVCEPQREIHCLRLPLNCGVSRARNLGVAQSRGTWIAFLDSDDQWHREKLARQIDWIGQHLDYRIVQTREIWVRNAVRVNPPKTHEKIGGDIFPESLQRCMVTPSSVMLQRSLFEEVGGFNEALPACEDYDLWLRIACRWPVGLVDEHLMTRFGGHEDQLSSTVASLDRFRIRSLLDLLASDCLSPQQYESARQVLVRKAAIMANGLLKRNREQESLRYQRIVDRFQEKHNG